MTNIALVRYSTQLLLLTENFLALPDSRRNSYSFARAVAEVARLMEREAKLAEQA